TRPKHLALPSTTPPHPHPAQTPRPTIHHLLLTRTRPKHLARSPQPIPLTTTPTPSSPLGVLQPTSRPSFAGDQRPAAQSHIRSPTLPCPSIGERKAARGFAGHPPIHSATT